MAKGFVMGGQFVGLFENGNYIKYCKKAVENADMIRYALKQKGIELESSCEDFQIFAIFKVEQYNRLAESFDFGGAVIKGKKAYARICVSWATKREKVERLIEGR